MKDGEQKVLRNLRPVEPAEVSDVLASMVDEATINGWDFIENSEATAVATKEIDGQPWMVSLAIRDDVVRQILAGG